MDHFSSIRRLNNMEFTDTRRVVFNFRDYTDADEAYYKSRSPPTTRPAFNPPPYDYSTLPPPQVPRLMPFHHPHHQYYHGYEPQYAPPPPRARYPPYPYHYNHRSPCYGFWSFKFMDLGFSIFIVLLLSFYCQFFFSLLFALFSSWKIYIYLFLHKITLSY